MARAAEAGIDLPAITDQLERAGVETFRDSYEELLARIDAMVSG